MIKQVPNLNLGVTQWTLDVKGVATIARAAELGFSYVQLDAGGWADWPDKLVSQKDFYKQAALDAGIELIGIGLNPLNEYSLLAPIGSSELKKAVSVIEDAIDVAKFLNIPLVYVPGFNASEMKSNQDIKRTAELLAELAIRASEQNVTLASENTLSAEQQLRLLEYANHPDLKLFMDIQNPVLFGHNVSELIKQLKEHLCQQMHLKDGKNGVMGNCFFGKGEAHFYQTADMIKVLRLEPIFVFENEYSKNTEKRVKKDQATVLEVFA
jgi:sugar phosphate isomerase/epimerase